jgi:phosphoribosylformylglycinamidine synthase subunit PurSL
MEYRIEISYLDKWRDAKSESVKKQITEVLKLPVESIKQREVYTLLADVDIATVEKIAEELNNPVIQNATTVATIEGNYNWLIIVGYRPGVTDNVGRTAITAIGDIIGRKLVKPKERVFSSAEYLLNAPELSRKDAEHIGKDLLANELIQSVTVMSKKEVEKNGIPHNIPIVTGFEGGNTDIVNLDVSDSELEKISKDGILALSLDEMKAIQGYFRGLKDREKHGLTSEPTDVELECLAQTWSEHCSHKIFDAIIDYEDENGDKKQINSCYKTFIKKSTYEIKEEVDWLVSVFHDNAGVIAFNDKIDLVYKAETHNSPSALDPYGGSMTGIVGVNRDPMGTGQGANLLINVWGYCLGSPFTDDKEVPEGLLHPRRLRDGVHKGVIDGGNQSGLPYGLGWEFFDERYIGKPLVFCGTVGTLPKQVGNVKGFEKSIEPGDLIVMTGGRIGKDGIHGATFSSEELHKDSPVQAVQIGDPITQKMMSDFIYEIRDKNLYRFVTDNGAGGLSSSIGEMASLCDGCEMDLGKAPLKYSGLDPWEILVSEAQERMSFAVPRENIEEFKAIASKREVEATVLGKFTDTGKFHMLYNDKTVAYMDIEFMHKGCPKMHLKAKWETPKWNEPSRDELKSRNIKEDIINLSGSLNICSNEYKSRQYDHEVKGLNVIKPYTGKDCDVRNDSSVFMAEPLGKEGIVLASSILPRYSDIDTYHMMASAIDLAVRRTVAAGADYNHIAGLDNFCWPDPVKSEKTPDGEYKLAQLVRANQALYDYTKIFKCPCISGKDSMKNDSTRGGKKISIPPTVLFSTIAKIADISKSLALTPEFAGDYVYVVGDTNSELGGSEYLAMLGFVGNNVPKVDGIKASMLYKTINVITDKELVRSICVPGYGGLAIAFARMVIAGKLGLDIDLSKVPVTEELSKTETLFSETNTRFVITVAPEKAEAFENILKGVFFAKVGKVTGDKILKLGSIEIKEEDLEKAYKATLDKI